MNNQKSSRRKFLKNACHASIAVSVPSLNDIFHGGQEVIPASMAATTIDIFMKLTKWIGANVLAPVAVKALNEYIDQSEIIPNKKKKSFHDQYSSPMEFASNFPLNRTIFGGSETLFGVYRFPVSSVERKASQTADFNFVEMMALQDRSNKDLWANNRLSLLPVSIGERRVPNRYELDMFYKKADQDYLDPDYIHYVRDYCACSGSRLFGFGWADTQMPNRGKFAIVRVA